MRVFIGKVRFPPYQMPSGQSGELAQGQKSAEFKHILHDYSLWAISGNWPGGWNCSRKIAPPNPLPDSGGRLGEGWPGGGRESFRPCERGHPFVALLHVLHPPPL